MAEVFNPQGRPFSSRNFSYDNGNLARNLYGSCVALALGSALGMPYKHATAWVLKHGGGKLKEQDGKKYVAGAYVSRNLDNYMNKLGREGSKLYLTPNYKFMAGLEERPHEVMKTNCKLSTFAKKYNNGRFLVLVKGHCLAVVNGQIFDNNEPFGLKNYVVQYAIELGTKK